MKYSGWELFTRVVELSVSGGIDINDAALYYEENPEAGRVRIYWYPDTPIGSYEVTDDTVSGALAKLEQHSNAHEVAGRLERPKKEYIKGS